MPNFENGVCFVINGDENYLVQKMLKSFKGALNAAYEIMKRKFDCAFQALEICENVRKENLTKKFEAFCRELIVIGFNSASYDLKLRFLDIRHFLTPGFSYRKFLIAYGSIQTKFYFPYEFVTNLTKLQSGLSEHQAFYSSLRKSDITKEGYEFVKKPGLKKAGTL